MMSAISIIVLFMTLVAGFRYPGALIGGTFFTYLAGSLSSHAWVGSVYVAVAAAFVIVRYMIAPHRMAFSPIDAALFVLTLFLCGTQYWSPYPDDTLAMSLQLILSVFGMYMIARFQRAPLSELLYEMNVTVIVVGAIMSYGLLAERVTGGSYAEDTRLLIGNDAASAVGMAQPLPFVLFAGLAVLFFARSWMVRIIAAGSFALTAYVSIVSATRSIFVALGIAAVLTLLIGARRIPLRRYVIGAVAGVAGIAAVITVIPADQLNKSMDRLLGNFGSKGVAMDNSGQERVYLYHTAEGLFADHPVLGSSYGVFGHYAFLAYPHNMFLEIAAAGGLIGLVLLSLWLLYMIAGLFKVYRLDAALGAMLFGYVCVGFVQMQVSYPFFVARPLFLMSAVIAVYATTGLGQRVGRRARRAASPQTMRFQGIEHA